MPSDQKIKVGYVASSSYSGSTLLAFLLNTHPRMTTVSEMDGWDYTKESEPFACSCGQPLPSCPFSQNVAHSFQNAGLPFEFHNFGTRYTVLANERLDQYATEYLPGIASNALEKLRDHLVWSVPRWRRRLQQQDYANLVFIRTALAHAGASVFIDACKSPFRLRHLRRLEQLELCVVHLVRDPRGVSLSNMRYKQWSADRAARHWIADQRNIKRVVSELRLPSLDVYYEDLVKDPDRELGRIHELVGLEKVPFRGDFRVVEHHLLGNKMRLQEGGTIRADTRWRRDLQDRDRRVIEDRLDALTRSETGDPLRQLVDYYLAM
jgi:hypothetical protein